jgi:hypothetical protein
MVTRAIHRSSRGRVCRVDRTNHMVIRFVSRQTRPLELWREWLSCQGVVGAQLDAYVGGSGEWATGVDDDDDDYEDECVAETWRDGGVLSEANLGVGMLA